MQVWVEPERIPLAAAAGAMLLLAVWLLAVDFQKRAHRAFAAFLVVRGIALLLPQVSVDAQGTLVAIDLQPYFALAALPAILYFLAVYPRPRGPFGHRGVGWGALALALILDGAYLANHALFHVLAPGPAPIPILQAASGLQYLSFGPLAFTASLTYLAMAVAGWVVTRDYLAAPAGLRRTTYLLVAMGFILNGLFDGARGWSSLVRLAPDAGAFPWQPWGWAVAVLPAAALLPSLAALVQLIVQPHDRSRTEASFERRMFALAPVAMASGLLPIWLGGAWPPGVLVALGLWRLCIPLLVTYALLHYPMFDIDRRTRRVVSVAAAIGAYLLAYWFVSALAGLVAPWYLAGALGSMVATALLLAARPVARFAGRIAQLLVPATHEGPAGVRYAEQRRLVLEAGHATPRELRGLQRLRKAKQGAA